MSDSWMARKLEAQLAGRYLMSSVLMTSTMKSDPGMPGTRPSSRGVLVSASTVFAEGGRAEGARGPFCAAEWAAWHARATPVPRPAPTIESAELLRRTLEAQVCFE